MAEKILKSITFPNLPDKYIIPEITVDSTPTQGSTNAVSSGGVYETLDTLQAQISQIDTDEFDRKIYAAYVTDTASGSIASFPDGADDIPLKSCIVQIAPVQAGSGNPSPDNVRPISGWTGANVVLAGKNLFNVADIEEGTISTTTGANVSNTSQKRTSSYIPVKGDTKYRIDGTTAGVRLHFYDSAQNYLKNTSIVTSNVFIVPETASYVRIAGNTANVEQITQIEAGELATEVQDYVAPTGLNVTFPEEAGIVYGGILDVTQGKLTITTGIINLGTLKYTKNDNVQYAYASINDIAVNPIIHCDSYEVVPNQTSASSIQNAQIKGRASDNTIFIRNDDFSTGSEYKTGLNGCYLTYTLAESKVYYLALHEIRTLLGTNNIWADCGDVSVEYRADTTLYIKRLTDSDTDMVADANIVSGQYFMVGNDLYKATVNIASGASVIVGTNATKVSLAQALNEINA